MAAGLPSVRTLHHGSSDRPAGVSGCGPISLRRILRSGVAMATAVATCLTLRGPFVTRADSGWCEGENSPTIEALTPVGARLFFSGGSIGALWTSDGTTQGTTLVESLGSGPDGVPASDLTDVAGTLYFAGWDRLHGSELWRSDGTAEGTTLVRDIRTGHHSGLYPSETLVPDGRGGVYFAADDGHHGLELWSSDGTAAGTHLVTDLRKGHRGSHPQDLTLSAGAWFYAASSDGSGLDLYRSDGTAQDGAAQDGAAIKHFPGSRDETYPIGMASAGGQLLLVLHERALGVEVWRSDGTTEGTVLLGQIAPGRSGSVRSLSAMGDALYLSADDGKHGTELWRTDGTTEGTLLVADILPGPLGSAPSRMVDAAGTLFFGAGEEPYDRDNEDTGLQHLWRTDGTSTGTVRVSDVTLTGESGAPSGDCDIEPAMASVGRTLYFGADDRVHGSELWRSDGTADGTKLVADIVPGTDGSGPYDLTVVGDTLYFVARGGTELWRSDGTAGGTERMLALPESTPTDAGDGE